MIDFFKRKYWRLVLLLPLFLLSLGTNVFAVDEASEIKSLKNENELLRFEKRFSDLENKVETSLSEEKNKAEKQINYMDNGWKTLNSRETIFDIFVAVMSLVIGSIGAVSFLGSKRVTEQMKEVEKDGEELKKKIDKLEKEVISKVDDAIKNSKSAIDEYINSAKESLGEIERIEEKSKKADEKITKIAQKLEKTPEERSFIKKVAIEAENKENKSILDWYLLADSADNNKNYDNAEKYFEVVINLIKAEDKEKEYSWIIGNYAIFLKQQGDREKDPEKKKDFYKRAEEHYQIALKNEPKNANINGNYALFLEQQGDREKDPEKKKDFYKRAEKHYQIALKNEPEDANINGNYANFLEQQGDREKDPEKKKDFYKRAEEHYQIALKNESENAIFNGNYAGFLFAQGRNEEAEKCWEKAFDNYDKENEKPLLLELYFYHYAHAKDENVWKSAKEKAQKLLDEGIESPYFNLTGNVQRAWTDNHEEKNEVKKMAEDISKLTYNPK